MRNFGYKICYKERGSKKYIRYFMTYTYPQALKILYYFISYPPDERETGRKLIQPEWRIIPVTKKEILAGIWRECPF
jgi:hypothetical protein